MKYKVNSNRIDGHKVGDFVTADDLQGCNMEALVAAGHLQETTQKSDKPKQEK